VTDDAAPNGLVTVVRKLPLTPSERAKSAPRETQAGEPIDQ
jgi:hypothetical protein